MVHKIKKIKTSYNFKFKNLLIKIQLLAYRLVSINSWEYKSLKIFFERADNWSFYSTFKGKPIWFCDFVCRHFFYIPGWCGSVGWTLACEPKGSWLDSQSGYMPGFWARSSVGGDQEATTHWCFSPLCLPPFHSLKINK